MTYCVSFWTSNENREDLFYDSLEELNKYLPAIKKDHSVGNITSYDEDGFDVKQIDLGTAHNEITNELDA